MAMKNSKPLIEDIMKNPGKYNYPPLTEAIIRSMGNYLSDEIDSDVKKYFSTYQKEPIQNDKREEFQSPFVSRRYADQFLEKSKNEKDEPLSERDKIEEMINYGKDNEEY